MTNSLKRTRNFTTERLELRPFSVDQDNFFYQLNSDPEVLQYTGDVPFKDVAEARQFLEEYRAFELTGFERLTVVKDLKPIGWCGMKLHEDGEVDLGFRFLKSAWGKGYATESAKVMIDYAFESLELEFLIARVLPENAASIRVLEKLGFKLVGKTACNDFQNALKYILLPC
jgi:RimJ/RimL family protein N-acetyltransferase